MITYLQFVCVDGSEKEMNVQNAQLEVFVAAASMKKSAHPAQRGPQQNSLDFMNANVSHLVVNKSYLRFLLKPCSGILCLQMTVNCFYCKFSGVLFVQTDAQMMCTCRL